MNEELKISIIIPVYNAEKFLRACVESLQEQRGCDFEIILVDDGSTDRSSSICDEYAEADSRIRVIHKPNGGVSSARNMGLKAVTGNWLMFVDADDMLYPGALQKLAETISHEEVDILQFAFNRKWEVGQSERMQPTKLQPKDYLQTNFYKVCAACILVKASLIYKNHITFNESVKLAEDQMFVFDLFNHANTVMRIGDILYYYRDNPASATNNTHINDVLQSVEAITQYKKANPLSTNHFNTMIWLFVYELVCRTQIPLVEVCRVFEQAQINMIGRTTMGSRVCFLLSKVNIYLSFAITRLCKKRL